MKQAKVLLFLLFFFFKAHSCEQELHIDVVQLIKDNGLYAYVKVPQTIKRCISKLTNSFPADYPLVTMHENIK